MKNIKHKALIGAGVAVLVGAVVFLAAHNSELQEKQARSQAHLELVDASYNDWLQDYDRYKAKLDEIEEHIKLAEEYLATNPDVEDPSVLEALKAEAARATSAKTVQDSIGGSSSGGTSASSPDGASDYNPGGHRLSAAAMKYNGHGDFTCDDLVSQSMLDLGYPACNPGNGSYAIVTQTCTGNVSPVPYIQWENYFHPVSDAQPGDVLSKPGHVAIYLGGGKAIHGGLGGCLGVGIANTPLSGYSILRLN